jgi:hypothetical protein
MNVFERAAVPSAWTTRDGGIAHITHVLDDGWQTKRIAGLVENLSHSEVWDAEGHTLDGQGGFDLIKLIEKKEEGQKGT